MNNQAQLYNYTQETVSQLWHRESRWLIQETWRKMQNQNITPAERKLWLVGLTKTQGTPAFFTYSYFIYLCNAILLSDNTQHAYKHFQQLSLEFALHLVRQTKQIAFPVNQNTIFSLTLNQNLPAQFEHIVFKDGDYYFLHNKQPIAKISRNQTMKITDSLDFLITDRNPFNDHNDHPDAQHTPYDLGGKTPAEWVSHFKRAYTILQNHAPNLYAEILPFLDALVPMGYIPMKQLSSSYLDSPGILYLSYTDSDTIQAEALVHEVHHTIYNIIDRAEPLLENDLSLKYYSAYRPDARHIRGCFLGLHAFVAVQNFYREIIDQTADLTAVKNFMLFYEKNRITHEVITKYGQLTTSGQALLDDVHTKWSNDIAFYQELRPENPDITAEVDDMIAQHWDHAKNNNEIILR